MKNSHAILFLLWIIIGHSCIQDRPNVKCLDCQRYRDTVAHLRDVTYQVNLINQTEKAKEEARKIFSHKK